MSRFKQWLAGQKNQIISGVALLLLSALFFFPLAENIIRDSRTRLLQQRLYFDDSAFGTTSIVYLAGADWLTLEEVLGGLNIAPDADYEVTRDRDDRFAIFFKNPGKIQYFLTYRNDEIGVEIDKKVNEQQLTVRFASLNVDNFGVSDTIVLEFNHSVGESEMTRYLSISPDVPFEMFGRDHTFYLRPNEPFAYDTNYTIAIRSGLPSYDESVSLLDTVTLNFHTQRQGFHVSLINPATNVVPDYEPEVALNFNAYLEDSPNIASVPMEISVYRFPDLRSYLLSSDTLVSGDGGLEHLELAGSYMHELTNQASNFGIPNPGLGSYIIHMSAKDPVSGNLFQFRKAFSVTQLSVYAQTSGTQTLVWVNSSATGQALPGYTVQFMTTGTEPSVVEAVTDSDGVALLNYVYENFADYKTLPIKTICLRDERGEIVYVDNTSILNSYNQPMRPNRYYSFLMLDRPIYRPTDEIQFWGMVRPWKDNRDPMPATFEVILGEGRLDQIVEVSLNSDGTFQGKMELETVKSADYSMKLKLPSDSDDNDEYSNSILASEYFKVRDFQKPAYVIATETDQEFYRPGENVTVEITPSFYDGTPAPFFEMDFMVRDGYYGELKNARKIVTNEKGSGSITFSAHQSGSRRSWLPSTGYYMVKIGEDGENIEYQGSYRYLPASTITVGSVTEDAQNGKLSLKLETAALSLANVHTLEDLNSIYYNPYSLTNYRYTREQFEKLRGAPEDITVEVNAEYYYYDSRKEWRYDEWTRSSSYVDVWDWTSVIRNHTVKTKNGVAVVDDLLGDIKYDTERYCRVNITLDYTDSAGNPCSATVGWNGRGYRVSTQDVPTIPQGYNFRLTNQVGEDVTGEYAHYLSYNEASYGNGDAMNFHLQYQDKPARNNGRILYTVLQGEIVNKGVTTNSSIHLTQNISNANNFNLVAAYFDGVKVWPIRDTIVSLDKASINLNVEVSPDRQSYGPGDTVTMTVKVTDPNNQEVSCAIGISIVDESIFALEEQYIGVMYDLYSDFFFNRYYVRKYATGGDIVYKHEEESPEYAEGGGGEDGYNNLSFHDGLRKKFRDTAFFHVARTDASGNATVSFKLPDNVTSWRITGVAIGDNLYAGQSKANFISTMPFFVSPVISSKYIDGDDIALLVQGHGLALGADSDISYVVNIKGDGVDLTKTLENKAYHSNEINFGKLPQGEYTVRVLAVSGDYSDAVELPLAVIKSNLELVISKSVDITKPLDINAMRYPVTITFYEEEHDAYYSSISSLLTHYCMMASQRMSRFTAKRALSAHMEETDIPQHIRATGENIADMQNFDGGIGTAPGNPSDPYVTTMVLIVAKDQFNLDTMASYFESTLAGTENPAVKGACYLGLAVIGRPVGDEIRRLAEAPETDELLRAYLIAAMAYLGEEGTAGDLYEKHITPHMNNEFDGRYYGNVNGGSNDGMTAAVWVAASRLGHNDADGISLYFSKYSWRINTLFECMVYITHYSKEVPPRSFIYNVNGNDVRVDLGLLGQKTVSFNKSEFETLRFTGVPKGVAARAYFIGEPSEVDITPSNQVSITKDINIISGSNGRYRVTITLDFADDAPLGQYDISEWVPSNMRLYSIDPTNRYSGDHWWYSYRTEGQKIYFYVYRNTKTSQIKLQYTAQKTYDGKAVVDSAYVIHGESGINNLTPRGVI